MGDGSECVPPKEKGGNNRMVKLLYRQKDERTKGGRNRDTLRGREYVEMNGRYRNRDRQGEKI